MFVFVLFNLCPIYTKFINYNYIFPSHSRESMFLLSLEVSELPESMFLPSLKVSELPESLFFPSVCVLLSAFFPKKTNFYLADYI